MRSQCCHFLPCHLPARDAAWFRFLRFVSRLLYCCLSSYTSSPFRCVFWFGAMFVIVHKRRLFAVSPATLSLFLFLLHPHASTPCQWTPYCRSPHEPFFCFHLPHASVSRVFFFLISSLALLLPFTSFIAPPFPLQLSSVPPPMLACAFRYCICVAFSPLRRFSFLFLFSFWYVYSFRASLQSSLYCPLFF